jgi:radical SAM family RiPP maturation amino acid epimerase
VRFDAWRKRQITRCAGELGLSSDSIVHPVITFELSDGCSVGCWFCGISADKFKGAWPYEPNQHLWHEVLRHSVEFFGPAAATGFCYWATDPSDNPDYPRFIDDFFHMTGILPQTTTAAPLKDVALTRQVLTLSATYRTTVNRFSVLNKKGVRKIHETFTPDELLGVELVTQNREAAVPKAVAGRARLRATERAAELSDEHTTIACVTGFLVKMPLGLVQLVTPCRSTDETPDGYFIMAERRFSDGPSFAKALRELEESMALELGMGDTLALRRDVQLEKIDGGFTLRDKSWLHTVNNDFATRLAEILTAGTYTIQEAYDVLLRDGVDVFELAELLDWMFEKALLNEDPKHPGIRGLPNWQAAA